MLHKCSFITLQMTDKQLGEVFAKYGNVKDSKIIADRSTGKSKG